MRTQRLIVDAQDLDQPGAKKTIQRAAEILQRGGIVAFPTETVYGLGANALSAEAVARIFCAKQRPSWDPLIVHVSDEEMLHRVAASVPANAQRLIDVFWPGPLTLLLPRHPDVPAAVTAGRNRVGVRRPAHPVAQALIRAAGLPIAAPSANLFGRTSPTLADHVAEDLDGRIDAILDAGGTAHGLESTVVDPCGDPCIVYRPGVITLAQIKAVCTGEVVNYEPPVTREAPQALPSPGVGLRHYAPRARLALVDGSGDEQKKAFSLAARTLESEGRKLGVMLPDAFERSVIGRRATVYRWGSWNDPEELAHRLFAGLRMLDSGGVDVILCPLPAEHGIGAAIRDRLRKAALPKQG